MPAGAEGETRRPSVLRAMDKLDRLGIEGLASSSAAAVKDESGDFTRGAGLAVKDIDRVLGFLSAAASDRIGTCKALADLQKGSAVGEEGADELLQIDATLTARPVSTSAACALTLLLVRGLAYYTGPVSEAELTFEVTGEDGRPVRFGSVGGGGRYDDLVERFLGKKVPATGVSIGSIAIGRCASRCGDCRRVRPISGRWSFLFWIGINCRATKRWSAK